MDASGQLATRVSLETGEVQGSFVVASKSLCTALVDVYVGDKPISKPAKESILAGVDRVVGPAVAAA